MKVLGISGSLRRDSHNTALLRAAAELLPPAAELELFDGLGEIPPYSEDDEDAGAARRSQAEGRRSPTPTPSCSRRPSTTTRSPASSRTRSTGSPGRSPSNPLQRQARGRGRRQHRHASARSGPRRSCARCSARSRARVVDRELPVGSYAAEAFDDAGHLISRDLDHELHEILADLAALREPALMAA